MNSLDNLAGVDALEIDAGDAKVGVPELPLDDDQWDALVGHFDRVRVPQLVRRESPSDACCGRGAVQLLARGRCFPTPSRGRSVDHAQQRADREPATDLEPWIQVVPRPAIHADLAATTALTATHQHRAACRIQVGFGEIQRLTDP